jgi:hypothetical protein
VPCFADSSLADLHVQRAALYKTLCSFATTDADEGLEDAISDTKQARVLDPLMPALRLAPGLGLVPEDARRRSCAHRPLVLLAASPRHGAGAGKRTSV